MGHCSLLNIDWTFWCPFPISTREEDIAIAMSLFLRSLLFCFEVCVTLGRVKSNVPTVMSPQCHADESILMKQNYSKNYFSLLRDWRYMSTSLIAYIWLPRIWRSMMKVYKTYYIFHRLPQKKILLWIKWHLYFLSHRSVVQYLLYQQSRRKNFASVYKLLKCW